MAASEKGAADESNDARTTDRDQGDGRSLPTGEQEGERREDIGAGGRSDGLPAALCGASVEGPGATDLPAGRTGTGRGRGDPDPAGAAAAVRGEGQAGAPTAVGDAGLCLGEATGGGPAGFDGEPGATRRAGGRAASARSAAEDQRVDDRSALVGGQAPHAVEGTKGRRGTKPGTLLRHQVPIRTFADWDEACPGFVEVDLVGHEGGLGRGDYAQTLDVTDLHSGWTELAAVRNKAQVWVFEALQQIRERLPFELLGLDSDNGAEFINYQLHRYCGQEQITFTRSRPLRKNDNCFVEQKNYSVVRRFAGYARYGTETELEVLKQLYGLLSPYVNFFLPSQKLQEKIRQGSRVTKRYDRAQTPDRRLLDSTQLSKQAKAELRRRFRRLNPAQLHREIVRLQEQLVALQTRKRRGVEGAGSDGKAQGGFPTAPWETPRKEFPTPPCG